MAFGGDNAESYYDEGLTASMKGDVAQAAEFFERAIRLDNSLVAAYHQLGRCCIRLGEPKKAVSLLEQVVQARPQQVPPRLDLGQAYLELGQTGRAREAFAAALDLKPEDARGKLGLAECAYADGNWDVAINVAQSVANRTGGFAALYLLGRAAKAAGQDDIAAQSLKQADVLLEKQIESTPMQPEAHFLRGEVAVGQNKVADALDHYRAAEDRAEPGKHYLAYGERFCRTDILMRRALCLKQLGRDEAARELAEQILRADPNYEVRPLLEEQ